MTENQSRVPPFPGSPVAGFRSGFAALIGRPGVGKSTLVNRLVGQKIAITAAVPQITRSRLSGILTLPHAQIVFVDTPGLHRPRHRLGEWMVEQATRALRDADAVLVVLDATDGATPEDRAVIARLGGIRAPVIAVLNKIDRVPANEVAVVEATLAGLHAFAAVVPVSGLTGANLDGLIQTVAALLPEGPQYFPPEMVTDQPEQFLVRELVREAAIKMTREEVPYSIAVEIEEFGRREGKDLIYVRAILHVERDAHKKMLIGKEGRMLKAIGRRARLDVEALLQSRVYLDLWVKTSKGWREREELIKAFYPE
ncbi:MAG: GTPase Era [Bacillati bacterium ANGP1]|uniref:GTPase Era n=1 Tax=Candidatus Segetimicrobium genomatis TaxID=2569760 RepID=A0A537J0N9_9BACT|nr:MAG: GTPase Era [Terrabacteria group bacterium ANGP1]